MKQATLDKLQQAARGAMHLVFRGSAKISAYLWIYAHYRPTRPWEDDATASHASATSIRRELCLILQADVRADSSELLL